jgi:hypothetical protein
VSETENPEAAVAVMTRAEAEAEAGVVGDVAEAEVVVHADATTVWAVKFSTSVVTSGK